MCKNISYLQTNLLLSQLLKGFGKEKLKIPRILSSTQKQVSAGMRYGTFSQVNGFFGLLNVKAHVGGNYKDVIHFGWHSTYHMF